MGNENKPKNEATRATIGGEKIENKKVNLLDKSFEIPVYQRLYEWETAQIEELLNDIKKAFDESKENYFIGNITTSIKTNKDGQDNKNDETNKIYVLIDGQQRLTTLWFIGFYLANRECECNNDKQKVWQNFILKGDKLRIDMPIRDNEQNSLTNLAKKIVDGEHKFEQDKDGKVNLFKELQNIHQKIIEVLSCIESWFVNGNGKNIDLANFAKYIYENICFVFVTLAENTDLNRFFVRMNNRGKQLEKHEILKARMLGVIQKSGGEWQKYAKIWDLCSDMDKYIFQSASDRSIFAPKSQGNNDTKSINDNDSLVKLADIVEKYKIPETNKSKEKDLPSKVESIIDFPTFLLHCYKLWVAKKFGDKANKITVSKDKLLEIMWENKDSDKKEILCDEFIFDSKNDANEKAKQNCKEFIIDMLHYRVLFDYFVIKNTLGDDGFAIMRLDKNNQPKAKSFKELAMIQNYLRVARQGERQNYHHWLTPFLRFLSENNFLDCKSREISNNQNTQRKKKIGFFQSKAENLVENLKVDSSNKENEAKCVEFLQKLDTKLAIEQLPKESSKNGNENTLLPTSNEILRDLDSVNHFKVDKKFSENDQWSFLKYGNEIRYWFYRLEYYLWKKRGESMFVKVESNKRTFKDIAGRFYFRNLNSIEHIQPQSKAEDKVNGWKIYKDDKGNIIKRDIDCFGNLALISPAFNSQLSNQSNRHKELDLRKKIDDGNAESLKLWLVYAQYIKDGDKWTCGNAKRHLIQMLKILKQSLEF